MVQHTRTPTSEEYSEVCRKLVEKFPNLHDGGTTGSVSFSLITLKKKLIKFLKQGSWKLSLRTGFKNFRRDHPPQSSNTAENPSKKRKTVEVEGSLSEEEYDDAIVQLKRENGKRTGKNHRIIQDLMNSTRFRRRKWISEECPLAHEILERFPLFSSTKTVNDCTYNACNYVNSFIHNYRIAIYNKIIMYIHGHANNYYTCMQLRREFCSISGLCDQSPLMSEWSVWVEKTLHFAEIEAISRDKMKKILHEHSNTKDVTLQTGSYNNYYSACILAIIGICSTLTKLANAGCALALGATISHNYNYRARELLF